MEAYLEPKRRRYRWWHAVAGIAVANLCSALPAGYNGDEEFYARQVNPPGAPPGWVFAPVWAINNVLTAYSNLRVANLPQGAPGRRAALTSEAISWGLFTSFAGLYFGLRSPILGTLNTLAGVAVTSHGVVATYRVDRKAAYFLVPRLSWLAYASYVSTVSAVRSPDDLFGWRGLGRTPTLERSVDTP